MRRANAIDAAGERRRDAEHASKVLQMCLSDSLDAGRRRFSGYNHRTDRACAKPIGACVRISSTHFQFASENDMAAMSAPGVRLITAASDGDKKGVKKWLDQGVDVDSRDWDNLTPLIAASSQGHLVRQTELNL